MARFIEALKRDWPAKYGRPLFLLETYVDPRYFTGTVYRAANWIFLGQTRGFTKRGRGYLYHGHPKEVYVYPLEPDFRETIRCKRRPPRPPHRRHFTTETKKRAAVVLPSGDFSPAALGEAGITEEDLDLLAEELVRFRDSFHEAFNRPAQRDHALVYLKGLLSDLGAKSVEPIALRYRGRSGVRSLQRFLKDSPWDEGKLSDLCQARLHGHLADEGAVLTVDSSEFPKKGKESVGVARQYCGRLGKVENCQSGVFVGYSSPKGYGLVSCRLYMPERWFTPEYADRRQKCGVPEDLAFQSKAEIALELLRQIRASGPFPARWVACDAAFGRDTAFRDAVAVEGYWYLARVPSDTHGFTEPPRVEAPPCRGRPPCKVRPSPPPRTVAQVAADPGTPWRLVTLAEGAKGPIAAEVACLRVIESRGGLLAQEVWLLIRRDPEGAHQCWLSNAPAEAPLEEMARATALRWPIEQSFQEGKSELGMDHYELRSWRGWHRHML